MKKNIEIGNLRKLYFQLYENRCALNDWSSFERLNREVFSKDRIQSEVEKNPKILESIYEQIDKIEKLKLSKKDDDAFYNLKMIIKEQKELIEEFIKEWEASKK